MPQIYIIEGLDKLGKSFLINNIKNKLGFFQVIHFGKPEKLDIYNSASGLKVFEGDEEPLVQVEKENVHQFLYQAESFRNAMLMCKSGARIIFDRSWLGEAVYAPLYRGYSGDYVFSLEKRTHVAENNIRLILLTEDFTIAKHFVSDGESFDDDKRWEEQADFISAFHKSAIVDKRIINVTASDGKFRNQEDILQDAIG